MKARASSAVSRRRLAAAGGGRGGRTGLGKGVGVASRSAASGGSWRRPSSLRSTVTSGQGRVSSADASSGNQAAAEEGGGVGLVADGLAAGAAARAAGSGIIRNAG